MARAAARKQTPDAGDMQATVLRIAELLPNPRNPRNHSDDQLERLAAALRKDGQTKPLLARLDNRMLIAGHGVLEAARRIGWQTIRVLLLDVDQATADRMMLADNRLSDLSGTDGDRVAELLREVNQADWFAVGYSPEEVEKALGGGDTLQVKEIETAAVADEFWVNIRGPLSDQARALKRIKELLAEYPSVTIELGTVAGD